MRVSFSTKRKTKTTGHVAMTPTVTASYPSFAQIPAGQNPANWVLINGRYYFNDYDTTGNYLRAQFAR
jgi:hypothetical protein